MGLRKHKYLAAILIAVLVITATTGAVYAYLSDTGDYVTNTLTPEQDENPSVSVDSSDNTHTVTVNVGDPGYAVYVRAVIVVTWRKDDHVHATVPAYSVDIENDSGWFKQDDFYYYEAPVSSGSLSGLEVTCSESAPDGYELHIEVISQTIQALGTTDETNIPAVTDAWGISIDSNGHLVQF